jgi:hypothetical protein
MSTEPVPELFFQGFDARIPARYRFVRLGGSDQKQNGRMRVVMLAAQQFVQALPRSIIPA